MVQLLSTLFNCTLSSRPAGKKMSSSSSSNKVDLTSCGVAERFAAYSKKGKKGLNNQDCIIVWEEEFGCCEAEEMVFCGVFDGHGPWGHLAAKTVGQLMPKLLLSNWRQLQAAAAAHHHRQVLLLDNNNDDLVLDMWNKCYYKTCAAVDQQLQHHPRIDSFHSGTTALALVRQGDLMIVANVGDSRAVLATTSPDDGNLVATQLTTDFKPNLPHERERIMRSRGTIYCCPDEPGVHRVWRPNGREGIKGPGLAVSRSFGDFFIKDFGLISEPQITHRVICSRDQFVILATDGYGMLCRMKKRWRLFIRGWERAEPAKRLVERAACAWKHRGRANVMDDISVICLFFH